MPNLALQSLDITEYRSISGMQLEDFGRINLLVGGNNAGKTSVLEALALFCRPLDIENWINTAWRREIKSSRIPVADTLKWMFPKMAGTSPGTGRIKIIGEGRFDGKQLTAEYQEESVVAGGSGKATSRETSDEHIQPVLSLKLASVHLQQYHYYQTRPPLPPHTESSLSFRIGRRELRYRKQIPGVVLPLAVLDASAHRVESTVQYLYSAALESEAKNQDLKEEFIRILQKIDPGVTALELVQTGRVSTRLQIKHEQTGVTPLSALGDGFRRALMIAVTIPTVRGGVLLIDELETALHASVLKSVLGLLDWAAREFDVQVFATTHSLEAVDAVLAALPNATEDLVGYHLAIEGNLRRAKRYTGGLWERLRFERGLDIR